MRINSIYLRTIINLSVFLALLSNNLIIHKVNAQNQSNRELKSTENKISKNKYWQLQGKLTPKFLSQNTPQKSPIIIPGSNNINIPAPINPLENSEDNLNETDKIPLDNPDAANQKPSLSKNELEILILNAITNSAIKYPWIIDPRDDLNFNYATFNPIENSKYIDFSIKFSSKDSIFSRFTFANFPQKDQFYWVLPGNRVVVESKGWQSGVLYQGESSDTTIRETIRLTQRLWGMQTVFALPQSIQRLTEEIGFDQFAIESIAGEVTNPIGVPAASIIINNGNNSDTAITSIVPNITSINSEQDPLILQAFPTSNLQPLLGDVSLIRGSIISPDTLTSAGFLWGNPLTRQVTQYQPSITSTPGIKVGNREEFDNSDLFNILLNPSISENQRNLYYLNSLYWVSLGDRQNNRGTRVRTEKHDWHKFNFSYPHNRTLLEYDSLEAKATYTNIYTNPGLSLSLSFDERMIDEIQTTNSTLGMLLGGIFHLVDFPHLTQSLQEAKERFSRQESFASLKPKASPEQRRQINQRLNRTLFLVNRLSGLEQTSGKLTFPSTITSNSSSILQIRTGNHRRLIQFLYGLRTWREGETFISRLEVSNNTFGPLTSVSVPIPSQQTSNRSSAAQVTLTAPNGQQFRQSFSSSNVTSIPIDVRLSDIAFDRIELSQDGQITNYLQSFDGYLYLPSVEVLWVGSSGKWNYGIDSGIWFNLNPNMAFNITNTFGIPEPTLGIYMNGVLNHTNTYAKFDAEGRIESVTNHIPSLQFSWNSAANFQNPNYLNLSYFFSHRNGNLDYSLSTAFLILGDQFNLTPVGFFQGKIIFNSGLEFSTSLEIRDRLYYTLESIKQVNSQWAFGVYLENFRNIDRSIGNRVADFSYGLLIRRDTPGSGNFWESRIGMSGDLFEARFEGGLRF